MEQRSKYLLNGVYRCENFAQHVENNDCPEFPIGSALGLNEWYIDFRASDEIDGEWAVFPFISQHNHPKIQARAYFNIIKKDGSSSFVKELKCVYMRPMRGCIGKCMDIDLLLNEENGYLDEGALTVEYGLQVVAEEGEDEIWKFNFHDKFFEWQSKDYMFEFTFRRQRTVFCHKQIIKLHSITLDGNKDSMRVPNFFDYKAFHMCLQITHGVRLQMDAIDYRNVARIAFHYGFSNTVRYCERQLIVMEPNLKTNLFKLAVKCNMRSYLVRLLKQVETKKQLVNLLSRLDLKIMSSESIKAIVAKIFSL
ncbi:unnamed protein product [Caenorhabditis brenneri]